MELFRAFTVRENYKNRDTVIVDWFCQKRQTPVAQLERLVANLADLDEAQKAEAGRKLDQLLTAQEVDELAIYIRATTGFEVKRAKVTLPLADGRKAPDFSGRAGSAPGDQVNLPENGDYGLSIPICGFVDLSEPPNTHSMVHEG